MLSGLGVIDAFPLSYNFPFSSLNGKKALPVFGVSSQDKLNGHSIYATHDDCGAVFSKKKKERL